jgi:hypothetical protein
MKKLIAVAALAALTSQAHAALLNFTGNITYNTDVVQINFTLTNDATNVRVWTDSFDGGVNFDPITALWNLSTGARLGQNDDNSSVNPATQTTYDSGFTLASLAAGQYAFTVAAYNNFASGDNLADGFQFDGQTPVLISQWSQPSRIGPQTGSFWSVWLDGVDSATNPNDPGNNVPEPGSLALAALGLMGLASLRRRKAD